MTKLVAAIAVRNTGSRLYGKPIQNLDIMDSITILDNLVDCIKTISCIDEICLGISEGIENEIYIDIAKKKDFNISLAMSMMFCKGLLIVGDILLLPMYLE